MGLAWTTLCCGATLCMGIADDVVLGVTCKFVVGICGCD